MPGGHIQGAEGEFRVDVVRQGPPDHASREQVNEDGQVEPSISCRHVGNVTYPHAVWLRGSEVSSQKIRSDSVSVVGVRRPSKAPWTTPTQALFAHQSGHSFAANAAATGAKLTMNSETSVSPPLVLSMNLSNFSRQLLVGLPPRGEL